MTSVPGPAAGCGFGLSPCCLLRFLPALHSQERCWVNQECSSCGSLGRLHQDGRRQACRSILCLPNFPSFLLTMWKQKWSWWQRALGTWQALWFGDMFYFLLLNTDLHSLGAGLGIFTHLPVGLDRTVLVPPESRPQFCFLEFPISLSLLPWTNVLGSPGLSWSHLISQCPLPFLHYGKWVISLLISWEMWGFN